MQVKQAAISPSGPIPLQTSGKWGQIEVGQPLNPPSLETAEHTTPVAKATIEVANNPDNLKADSNSGSKPLMGRVKNFGESAKSILSHPFDSIGKAWGAIPKSVKIALLVTVVAICVIGFVALCAAPGGQLGILPIAAIMFGLVFVAVGTVGLTSPGIIGSEKPKLSDKDKIDKEEKIDTHGDTGTTQISGPDQKIGAEQVHDLHTADQQINLRKNDLGNLHKDLDTLKDKLNEKDMEITSERKKLVQLELIANTADPLTHDPLIAAAKQKVENLESQKAEIKSKIDGKKDEIEAAKQDLQPFVAQKNQINKEIADLKQKGASIEGDSDKFHSESNQERKVDSYLKSPDARIADLTNKKSSLDPTKPDYASASVRLDREIALATIDKEIATLRGNPDTKVKNKNELYKQMEATKTDILQGETKVAHLEKTIKILKEQIIQPKADQRLALLKELNPQNYNDDGTKKSVEAPGVRTTAEIDALSNEITELNEKEMELATALNNEKNLLVENKKNMENYTIVNEGIGKRIGDLEKQRKSFVDELENTYTSKRIEELTAPLVLELNKLEESKDRMNSEEYKLQSEQLKLSINNVEKFKENAVQLELKLSNINVQLKELKGPELAQAQKIYKPLDGHLVSPSASKTLESTGKISNPTINKPQVAEFDNTEAPIIQLSEEEKLNSEIALLNAEKADLIKKQTPLYVKLDELNDSLSAYKDELKRPEPSLRLIELLSKPKKEPEELKKLETELARANKEFNNRSLLESEKRTITEVRDEITEKITNITNSIDIKNSQLLKIKADAQRVLDEVLSEVNNLPPKVKNPQTDNIANLIDAQKKKENDDLDALLSSLDTSTNQVPPMSAEEKKKLDEANSKLLDDLIKEFDLQHKDE